MYDIIDRTAGSSGIVNSIVFTVHTFLRVVEFKGCFSSSKQVNIIEFNK